MAEPSKWSNEFSLFLQKCLTKESSKRSSASELLSDPFVSNATDPSVLKSLVSEYSKKKVNKKKQKMSPFIFLHRNNPTANHQ